MYKQHTVLYDTKKLPAAIQAEVLRMQNADRIEKVFLIARQKETRAYKGVLLRIASQLTDTLYDSPEHPRNKGRKHRERLPVLLDAYPDYSTTNLAGVFTDLFGVQFKEDRGHFVGLCPLHKEQHASFTISKGTYPIFKCFGCGRGGWITASAIANKIYGKERKELSFEDKKKIIDAFNNNIITNPNEIIRRKAAMKEVDKYRSIDAKRLPRKDRKRFRRKRYLDSIYPDNLPF